VVFFVWVILQAYPAHMIGAIGHKHADVSSNLGWYLGSLSPSRPLFWLSAQQFWLLDVINRNVCRITLCPFGKRVKEALHICVDLPMVFGREATRSARLP
jgi:hypothetical protein